MTGLIDIAGDPKNVTNINADGATVVLVPGEVVDCCLKTAIKIHSDQMTPGIQHRAAGVTASGVGVVQNCNRYLAESRVHKAAEVAAAALANGLIPTHNPCLVFDDVSVPREDARIAREEFGFLRMYSIHPAQIKPIVESMRPGADDISRAADILLAAQRADWGPISHRGEMHDRASYRYFWSLLKRARATGAEIPAAADKAFFPRDFPMLGNPSAIDL